VVEPGGFEHLWGVGNRGRCLESRWGGGGAGGIRTPYLLTASQTFSQVNYGPTKAIVNLSENGVGRN
jgi:hypothetical protein